MATDPKTTADLCARLRHTAFGIPQSKLQCEAADEIERLRAALGAILRYPNVVRHIGTDLYDAGREAMGNG